MFQFISPPMPHAIVWGEDTYFPGGRHPDRSNIGVFDLIAVTGGCLFLEEQGTPYEVPAGHSLILRPDRAHRTALPCREETHFYWLHFQTFGAWSEVSERQAPPLPRQDLPYPQVDYFSFCVPRAGRFPAGGPVEELFRSLLLLRPQQASDARWKQQQLFHELLIRLGQESEARKRNPQLAVAEAAADFLRRHYQEPLGYKRLAEALHFHANYISLCMKNTFGCTPLDYLTRHRVEQAKLLLIHTDEPIGAIAGQTGFGSFPYFVRCFSRLAGCRPKAFRMQYRS